MLLSIISVTTFSQEIDLRLLNRYSQDELIEMKNNSNKPKRYTKHIKYLIRKQKIHTHPN